MKVLLRVLPCLLVTGAYADTAQMQPEDFAYGLRIEAAEKAAIYRLELPEYLYQRVARGDVSDLRVFNAAGEMIPHSLRRPGPSTADKPAPVTVPFFPYELGRPDTDARVSVQVKTDERGAVVSVGGQPARDDKTGVSSYLADLSGLEQGPATLLLDWESNEPRFVAQVRVEGSDDLNNWRTLVSQATLVRLNFAGQTLERNRIELPAHHGKYLRITWPEHITGTRLTGVKVQVAAAEQPAERHWVELTGQRVTGPRPVFEYSGAGRLPVDQADLRLPEVNSLVGVTLSSRGSETGTWRQRYRGSFYRLQVDGTVLTSEPVKIPLAHDPLWRVEVSSDPSGLGTQVPVLRLGYVPHELYFLARGSGPYLLAFGAYEVPAQPSQVDPLLERINAQDTKALIADARIGEPVRLGGEARLHTSPPPFPWKRVLLWSVLVSGLLVLARMAWRLGKQLYGTAD